jgi:nucleoside-diphosphate-sugar epimerase
MKALVTGGAGFSGSHLFRGLFERGDRVVILDNFSSGRRSSPDDLAGEIELVEGDLRSHERVHAAMDGVALVFHQGPLRLVPRSVQDPLMTSEVNVSGTLNVLASLRRTWPSKRAS